MRRRCPLAAAAVAAMLLWLVLAQAAALGAKGIQDDGNRTVHIIQVTSCPDVGYFFKRSEGFDSAGACYLCFCKNEGIAHCWQQLNKRCNYGSYQPNAISKREARVRRSPFGLGDVFFRDAARDVFNKNSPETCKPFESSFSEGCPPDDWCVGCTVCDCDANGRWDCHILSFCPDKNNRSLVRTAKKTIHNQKSKSKLHYNKALVKTTKKPIPLKPQKRQIPPSKQMKETKPQNGKSVQNNNKASPKPLLVRKRIVKKKPVAVNLGKNNIKLNATDKEMITREVVKRVMAMMRRLLNTSQILNKQLLTVLPSPRSVEKRLMKNQFNKSNAGKHKPAPGDKKRFKKYISPVKPSTPSYKNKLKRQRRDVNFHDVIGDHNNIKVPSTVNNKMDDIKVRGANISVTTSKLHNNTNKDDFVSKYTNRVTTEESKLNTIGFNTTNHNIGIHNKNTTAEVQLTNQDQEIVAFNHLNNKSLYLSLNVLKSGFNTTSNNESETLKVISNNNSAKCPNVEHNVELQSSNKINRMMENVSNSYKHEEINNRLNKKHNENVFERLFSQFRINNTITTSKRRKFNFIKYLKRFFKKIFRRQNRAVSNVTNSRTKHNKKIIEAICEIFGKCNEYQKNNKLLHLKVTELNLQSHIILKSINIIKGLLHLIRIPRIPEAGNYKTDFSGDINKLNVILKGQYEKTLTDNEKTQIEYIKINMQEFIDAVGKFVNILSEIIKIITKQSKTTNHNIQNKRNLNKDFSKSRINVSLRQGVHDLKRVLVKYNLIQNSFMKKMYETLKAFERTKANTSTTASKVSLNNHKQNTSILIEQISRDIVENLRKLKILAETLNSKSRRKRSIAQVDSVNFLLTLMEYLLKSNSPMDAVPVNDGIDLLIDAIRNAPDVNSAKEKVLSFTPVKISSNATEKAFQIVIDDDISDDSHSLKEDSYNIRNGQHKSTERVTTPSSDNYRENEDDVLNDFVKYQYELITTQNPEFFFDTTLHLPEQTHKDSQIFKDDNKFLNKLESENEANRFEVFTDDLEDEESDEATSVGETTVPSGTPNILEVKQFTTTSSNLKNEERPLVTLGWLDEGYDQHDKEFNEKKYKNVTNTPAPTTTSTSRDVQMPHKQVDTVSSLSKEEQDEYDKRRLERVKTEHIMHKKQMDLLNSLDYGTEKLELIDAKDDREDASLYY